MPSWSILHCILHRVWNICFNELHLYIAFCWRVWKSKVTPRHLLRSRGPMPACSARCTLPLSRMCEAPLQITMAWHLFCVHRLQQEASNLHFHCVPVIPAHGPNFYLAFISEAISRRAMHTFGVHEFSDFVDTVDVRFAAQAWGRTSKAKKPKAWAQHSWACKQYGV